MDTVAPQPSSTSPAVCASLVGTPAAPLFVDVRKSEDFAASDYFIPGSIRWDYHANRPGTRRSKGSNASRCLLREGHATSASRAPTNCAH